jgi:RNA polymerase sigma-B factor
MTHNRPPEPGGREHLIETHLPLARSLARRYAYGAESLDDLEQTACIGLIKAADRYHPAQGTFTAFAVPTILGELRRHFRDRGWSVRVPRRLQERTLAVERTAEELGAMLRRAPTTAEVAQRLGCSEEEVLESVHAAGAHWAIPFAAEDDADGEADGPHLPGTLDNGFERVEERAAIASMLRVLKPHEQRIVLLRFHDELTQHEIALRLGMSQMGVSRALRRSLQRMRDAGDAASGRVRKSGCTG